MGKTNFNGSLDPNEMHSRSMKKKKQFASSYLFKRRGAKN